MNGETVGFMRNINGDFCFEKLDGGKVRLVLLKAGQQPEYDKPIPPEMIEAEHVMDDGGWGSVIANMSYYGENDYGWYRAMNFHTKAPIGESSPIKDKKVVKYDGKQVVISAESLKGSELFKVLKVPQGAALYKIVGKVDGEDVIAWVSQDEVVWVLADRQVYGSPGLYGNLK